MTEKELELKFIEIAIHFSNIMKHVTKDENIDYFTMALDALPQIYPLTKEREDENDL